MSHYMTQEEREQLEILYNEEKLKAPAIARRIGFCKQTIYNELNIGIYEHDFGYYSRKRYSADKAGQIHRYRQTNKGAALKIGNDQNYVDFLEQKMLGIQKNGKADRHKRYSPAAALAAARAEGYKTSVCVSTLYSYIDKRIFRKLTNKDLLEKGRRKPSGERHEPRTPHPALPSIETRPEHINSRGELGHKEIDLIVGCKGSRAAVLTIADRMGREEMGFRIPDKKAASVRAVFDHLERKLGKGSNENGNRLLRRFFLKGTNFEKMTQRQIQDFIL